MMYKNPNSKRENPFRNVYDGKEFKSVLQNKEALPAFPFLVDIELTNFCNLSCLFCGQHTMTRPKGRISREVVTRVIDECAEHGAPIRFIRWGEPFLHPEIIDFLRYAKLKNVLVHVTNNGLTLKQDQMQALVDLKLDSLIFSFQGATKEQYEVMRNNKRYDDLKANVLEMVRLRGEAASPFIHVSSTMTDETKEEIDVFVQFWGGIVDSVGVGKTNLAKLSFGQIKDMEAANKIQHLRKQETVKKCYTPCTEVYQKLSVDWDGKVSCCCSDFDNFLTVGDLKESSLSDIWNKSEKLTLVRDMLSRNMHKTLTHCSTCYHTYDEF